MSRRKTEEDQVLLTKVTTNTKTRLWHVRKSKTKSSATKDLIRLDNETYRKWIEFQMSPEMIGEKIEL